MPLRFARGGIFLPPFAATCAPPRPGLTARAGPTRLVLF